MKPIPLYDYVRIGGILEYLMRCQQGTKIHGKGFMLGLTIILINIIENSDFVVSKAALDGLKHFKDKIEKKAEDYKLTSDERSNWSVS